MLVVIRDISECKLTQQQHLPGSMFSFLVENLFREDEDGNLGNPDFGAYAKLTWYLPI